MKFSFKSLMGNNITRMIGYSLIIVITVFILHNLYKVMNKEYFITLGGIPEAPLDASGNPLVPRNRDGVIMPQTMPNDLNGRPLLPLISSDGKSINYSNKFLAFISIPVILTYLRSLVGKPEFETAITSVTQIVNLYVPNGPISTGSDITTNTSTYSRRPSNPEVDVAATARILGITEPEVSASIALSRTPVVNLSTSEYLKITSSSTVPYSDPQYGNAQILKGGSNITISTTNLPETCTRFKWFLNGNVLPDCTTVDSCKFNATANLLPPDVSNTNIVNLSGYNSVGFACNGKLISRLPMWFN